MQIMIWLGVVLFLLVVMLWISLSHVHIQLYFSRAKDNDHSFIDVKVLGGLFSYRLDIPFVEYHDVFSGFLVKARSIMSLPKDQLEQKQKHQFTPERISDIYHWAKRLLAHVKGFTNWLRHMLTHVKCNELRWVTRIGVGDAPETALVVGLLWAVKSTMFGYIFQYVILETKPRISIQPQYNHTEFSTEFSCHAKVRIGFLFFSLLLLLWRIVKSKNGLKTWLGVLFRRNRVQKA
jgi:hypothetical protein